MRTQNSKLKTQNYPLSFFRGKQGGSVLVLAVVSLVILAALGVGLLTIAYGVRHRAIMLRNEAAAMLAAEAGYEKAIFWMGQQQDMLSALQAGAPGASGTLQFPDGQCDYNIEFYTFIGARPVYKVVSNGHSGAFDRTVEVPVVQALSGWDMGMCKVPSGSSSTIAVNYVTGEIIDIPIHINKLGDNPDNKDIYISGSPRFLREVAMGESRYTSGGSDKFSSVIGLFDGGIYFDQPDSRITNEATIQTKIDRFKNSTNTSYRFTPTASTSVTTPRYPAVQLEFFVDGGVGKVLVTNNCTVKAATAGTYDYEIVPGSGGDTYRKYNIYDYHFKRKNQPSDVQVIPLTDTYVSQTIGGMQSEPGGQIYVKGNVVIGSDTYTNMVVKGKITVVAAKADDGTGGNIWIADSIVDDGTHDATTGLPTADNNNIIGLIAQGVVKVVNPTSSSSPSNPSPSTLTYQPIGNPRSPISTYPGRWLPDQTVVEAAITVGGGGWGAEKVGNRREYSGPQDDLIVRGTITEAVRGVVGLTGSDGYLKHYYLDSRLLEGILPGDMWLRGKYIPAPAGWHDYRPCN